MSAEELADVNERLASPPEFDLADSDRLGLFVVGRLAARHGIRVTLRGSPYGGTTAVVLIPPHGARRAPSPLDPSPPSGGPSAPSGRASSASPHRRARWSPRPPAAAAPQDEDGLRRSARRQVRRSRGDRRAAGRSHPGHRRPHRGRMPDRRRPAAGRDRIPRRGAAPDPWPAPRRRARRPPHRHRTGQPAPPGPAGEPGSAAPPGVRDGPPSREPDPRARRRERSPETGPRAVRRRPGRLTARDADGAAEMTSHTT